MSTEAQINANRQNAQKSTGPKTAEGKAAVSQNAVEHGLFAAEAVIRVENPADYEAYHDEMLAELSPAGAVESMLAERIVSLSWRLKRAERMLNEVIDVKIERESSGRFDQLPGERNASAPNLVLGRIVIKDLANSRVLERLELYERRIERSLFNTIAELHKLRLMRKHEAENYEAEPAQAIPKACGFEAATRRQPEEKQVDLKKQTQFTPAEVGANSSVREDYDNKPDGETEENKPDQSQFNEPALPKGVGKRKNRSRQLIH